jgi:hypothetical protein
MYKELQDQYRCADIVTSIKVKRLEWAGHVMRMDDEVCVFDKPRRKKKTRKTKVKMAGLCEG